MNILRITKAVYLDGYRIQLWFNNGDVKVVDLSDSMEGPIFNPLKDVCYFKNFSIP